MLGESSEPETKAAQPSGQELMKQPQWAYNMARAEVDVGAHWYLNAALLMPSNTP